MRSRASAPKRAAALPDVPTLKELGYDVEFSLWVGLFAPKGTPAPVIAKLRAETKKVANSEQFKTAIDQYRRRRRPISIRPDFAKFWDEDAKRVEDAVNDRQRLGIAAAQYIRTAARRALRARRSARFHCLSINWQIIRALGRTTWIVALSSSARPHRHRRSRPGIRARDFSFARDHDHQRVSAGRRQRHCDAAIRLSARAVP